MAVVTTKLSAEDVRKAVELFWAAFLAKSEEELNDFYGSGSTVFQVAMGRSEPGRLGAMRRSREYFNPDTRRGAETEPDRHCFVRKRCGCRQLHFSVSGERPRRGWETAGRKIGNRSG